MRDSVKPLPMLRQLIEVLVVKVLVLPAQADGVVQRDAVILLCGFWHELPEYADAAVPEDGLGELAHDAPRSCLRVIGFQHIREFKGVIISPRDIELPTEHGHAAPDVNLRGNNKHTP